MKRTLNIILPDEYRILASNWGRIPHISTALNGSQAVQRCIIGTSTLRAAHLSD
ncbi:predicted protein [Histoplasma mississippiense (nom. inval.)]|uniref:predicted protein n=1 Tax=Ajellomyces capsulatus (strain NAm1 / WU24) TaxID=2059318 RepID=UPI000157B611|nr:predicted protein [Histoplasma mississippiense (nom. inval.)]EDN03121.1 predicted protein [Histoplasma mississippiense (nom. inval.)]